MWRVNHSGDPSEVLALVATTGTVFREQPTGGLPFRSVQSPAGIIRLCNIHFSRITVVGRVASPVTANECTGEVFGSISHRIARNSETEP